MGYRLFLYDVTKDTARQIRDPFDMLSEPLLFAAAAQNGIALSDERSQFDKFAAVFPLFFSDPCISVRYAAIMRSCGLPLCADCAQAWRTISDFLRRSTPTHTSLRFHAGSAHAFCVGAADTTDRITRHIGTDIPASLDGLCADWRARGVRALTYTLDFHPFFLLPRDPAQTAMLWEKIRNGRRPDDAERNILTTDFLYLLGRTCVLSDMRLMLRIGCAPVSPYSGCATMPYACVTDLADLLNYLAVRQALPRTMLCLHTTAALPAALALCRNYPAVSLGIHPSSGRFSLAKLPRNTVLLQDDTFPSPMADVYRKCFPAKSEFERYAFGNLFAFLFEKKLDKIQH